MASYNELLALIDAYINQNGVQAITGQVLNGVLRAMVDQLGRGYSIMGAADPTTDPGTPDGPETWFASVPGTYTNFDGIQIVDGELALLSYEPSTGFSKNTIYEGFQTVQATIDGNVGTPAVGVSYANGILSFDFHNMKGVTGDPAGFGAVTASVDSNIGTPSVQVQTSGPDTAKAIAFQFHNLKGETGVTSVLATVDNTSGNPQCAVSLNGQQLVLNFTGLKGAQGDTGSSVDYPFTIVNNLTTNDATQALSAAMGVQLESEVSQLQQEVDDISTGKYYGYFAKEEDLPEADVDGFAYVGEGPTYTIYNLRGGVWTSSDITVNQSPVGNDEDINQNENGKLQFSNRENGVNTSGMNYVILRRNKTFAEQVVGNNTIFEIRDNYNLGGASVNLPEGCVLVFNGGLLSNGTIVGAKTRIVSDGEKIFDNIAFGGAFVDKMNACWIGAKAGDSSFDNSVILREWFNNFCDYFPYIYFPHGEYYFLTAVVVNSDKRFKTIDGCSSKFYVNISTDDETLLTLNICENFTIKNVEIENSRTTVTYSISRNNCLHLIRTHRFVIDGVTIRYFDRAIHITDVWYGQFVGANSLIGNRIGIYGDAVVSDEINTILFNNLQVNGCEAAAAEAIYPIQTGETEENYALRVARCGVDMHCANFAVKYRGMVIEDEDYGIRFNHMAKTANNVGSSVIDIQDCYFEGMTTKAIYFGDGYIVNPNNLPGVHSFRNVSLTITSCAIHDDGIVSIYVKGCNTRIFSCTPGTKIEGHGYGTISHGSEIVAETFDVCKVSGIIPSYRGMNPDGSNSWYKIPANIRSLRDGFLQSAIAPKTSYNLTNNQYIGADGIIRFFPLLAGYSDSPRIVFNIGIQPNKMEVVDETLYANIKSGNGYVRVLCKKDEFTTCTYSFRNDGIDIDEFITKWQAGTIYEGYVNQVFPRKVRTSPSTGLVYMEDLNGDEQVFGLGKTAIDGGYAMGNLAYYILIDTLCYFRNAYSSASFNSDLVQNGRNYSEMHDTSGSQSAYDKRNIIVTTTQRNNLTPRFNATIYNKTNQRAEIFDGFNWVALTSPFTRYIYKDNGKSIAERAVVPDLPGQHFFNAATGIDYKYVLSGDKQSGSWVGSIGCVSDLTNPNGYDASKNPVAYATELSAGEMVMYNGALYKWDGTQFVAL